MTLAREGRESRGERGRQEKRGGRGKGQGGRAWLEQHHRLGPQNLSGAVPRQQLPCPHLLLPARCQWISLLWQGVGGHCGVTVRTSPPSSQDLSPALRDHQPSPAAPAAKFSHPHQDPPLSCPFPKSSQRQYLGQKTVRWGVSPPPHFCLQPLLWEEDWGGRGMDGTWPLIAAFL